MKTISCLSIARLLRLFINTMDYLKNIPFIILIFFCIPCYSQSLEYKYNIEAIYEMISQPDSTNKKSVVKEYMTLLIGERQSLFCATQFLVMDSAITAEIKRGNKFGPSFSFLNEFGTHTSLVIFKDDEKIITTDNPCRFITSSIFTYEEPKKDISWKVFPDTISLYGIACQKAVTEFGNRQWVAWFASAIPISDGPYKFCGLPGLILNISDVQNYWTFNLVSIKNTSKRIKMSFNNHIPEVIASKEAYMLKRKDMRDNRYQLHKLAGHKAEDENAWRWGIEQWAKKDNNWIELYDKQ